MYLRFIGENGSMGLVHGRIYNVDVISKGEYIYVKWGFIRRCPYYTPQSFAENWSK
jgi:hypothetical protein